MVVKYEKSSYRRLLILSWHTSLLVSGLLPSKKTGGKFKFVFPISFTIIYTHLYETKGEFPTEKRIFWADRKKKLCMIAA